MSNNTFTGYAASKFINATLKNNNIDFEVRPQMLYNYMKKGYIATNDEGLIEFDTLVVFTKKYVSKKINESKVNDVEVIF